MYDRSSAFRSDKKPSDLNKSLWVMFRVPFMAGYPRKAVVSL